MIAGRLAREQSSMCISHEAIYRYIYFRSAQKDYGHRLLVQKKHHRRRREYLGGYGGVWRGLPETYGLEICVSLVRIRSGLPLFSLR